MMKQIIVDNQVTPYYITDEGKCFNSKTNKYLKGHISECCRGKLKHYKGYIWKYKDDIV